MNIEELNVEIDNLMTTKLIDHGWVEQKDKLWMHADFDDACEKGAAYLLVLMENPYFNFYVRMRGAIKRFVYLLSGKSLRK